MCFGYRFLACGVYLLGELSINLSIYSVGNCFCRLFCLCICDGCITEYGCIGGSIRLSDGRNERVCWSEYSDVRVQSMGIFARY